MSSQLSTVMIPIVIAIITAVASYLVGRGMRSHDWQLTLAGERLLERQRLYAKFIAEVDRNGIVTADGDKSIENVMPLIALYSEISLLSTATVQECAKALCDLAVSLNAANEERNTTGHFAAKTAFIEAARGELREIEERGRKRAL